MSGACGSSWAGRRVGLGQRGTGVRAERGIESEGSLGRAGCEWSGGGLGRKGSLGCPRLGQAERNGPDWSVGTGWAREKKGSWAKRVGLGFFLLGSYFPFLFYSISKTNKHV